MINSSILDDKRKIFGILSLIIKLFKKINSKSQAKIRDSYWTPLG